MASQRTWRLPPSSTKSLQAFPSWAGPTTDAKPAEAAGQVVMFKIRRAAKLRTIPLLDGAETLSLLTGDGQPYAGGYHFVDVKKNPLSPRTITLYDKEEKPVALCLQKRAVNIVGREDYTIYGVFPMYEGHPSKTVVGMEGPVYEWMELEGIHMTNYYKITSYMHQKPYNLLSFKGKHKQVMSGMDKGVILTSLNNDEDIVAKLFHKKLISNDRSEGDVTGWDLTVAPGIDPLAIACITCILDHMEGQNI